MIHEYTPVCVQAQMRGGRKGKAPKGTVPEVCILGHTVKSCMTVIGKTGGALSEEYFYLKERIFGGRLTQSDPYF